MNVTDATDLEEEEGVGYRAHWKRVGYKNNINTDFGIFRNLLTARNSLLI